MAHHPYSEAALEEATLDLFAQLGWQVMDCTNELVGEGTTIGRDSRSSVYARA